MTETGRAYAKINISLDIISKMDNGYHSLKTIMQTVSLCDEITIECIPGETGDGSLSRSETRQRTVPCLTVPLCSTVRIVDSGCYFLPKDDRNIAAKAAKIFLEHTGISGYDLKISVKKNIPVCAGLGGGSADGACVLRMLDKMFKTNLERDTLIKLGSAIGSDVPFCIFGGTMLAEGRGEILTDIAPMPMCHIVICKPSFSFSTPELFKRVNCRKIQIRPDTDEIIAALSNNDLQSVAQRVYNVFEDFVPRGASEIEDIKSVLLDNGALGSVMTGSGPTVFGIFEDRASADKAYADLKKEYSDTYLAQPVEN